jgi:hypothetical protein
MPVNRSIASVVRRAKPRCEDIGDLTFLVLIRSDGPTYRQFTSIVGKDASLAEELGEAMMLNFCARCSRKA